MCSSFLKKDATHLFRTEAKDLIPNYFKGADWLQGPYVYALYASYGFDKSAIGQLFIAGFLSSGVFGTFVGSLADK